MAETKMRIPDTVLFRLPKGQKEVKEATRPGLKHFPARRHQKTRSVVDDTFAALPIKKHAQVEQIIEQTKYGE